jgi:hypothetical protein
MPELKKSSSLLNAAATTTTTATATAKTTNSNNKLLQEKRCDFWIDESVKDKRFEDDFQIEADLSK